jgi:hypothetical protein
MYCTEAAALSPKATVEFEVKPAPEMVTAVPPASGPASGEMADTEGASA